VHRPPTVWKRRARSVDTRQTVSYEQFAEVVAVCGEHERVVTRRSKDSTPQCPPLLRKNITPTDADADGNKGMLKAYTNLDGLLREFLVNVGVVVVFTLGGETRCPLACWGTVRQKRSHLDIRF